jgi:EAL domain-containing protein (putative c-di-GMP-specific phosphodiesterase class I)
MDKLNWTSTGLDPGDGVGGVRTLTVSDLGVVFQPIVELSTGQVFAHEALVRCRRPEYPSPPVLFECAVAESACGRLGRLIREVAFGTSGEIPLFVNLHPDELSSRWLVRPDDPLCFHSRPVFLEITESAAFTHFDLCKDVLNELCRRTGALLVVDDFGAGHSNLQRVVDLLPAIVKLDLALTRDIHKRPRSRAVVRHMVNLCTELGARVVAEGIEVVDELACVRDLGVHYAQGYLLARPAAPPPRIDWPFGTSAPVLPRAPGLPRMPEAPSRPKPMPPPLPKRAQQRPRPSRRAPPPTSGASVASHESHEPHEPHETEAAGTSLPRNKPKPPS